MSGATPSDAVPPRLNRQWHEANRMPANASTDQRIAWHLAHQQNCSCRPIPAKLQTEINLRAGVGA